MATRIKIEDWTTEESLAILSGWARKGLTDNEIAKNIGISRKTLSVWKCKNVLIRNTLKNNKEIADLIVENALFKSATGYDYDEDIVLNGKVVTITRHVPASNTAQIFWLKNRMPDRWREKQDINVEGNISYEKNLESVVDKKEY